MQTCPAWAKAPMAARRAAYGRSAPASMMQAALPPNSRMTLFRPATLQVPAHRGAAGERQDFQAVVGHRGLGQAVVLGRTCSPPAGSPAWA